MKQDTQDPDLEAGFPMPVDEAQGVAPISELSKLHGTLARALMQRLKTGRATAAEFGAAAKFLSDNNIDSKVGGNEAADKLKAMLDMKRKASKAGLTPADIARAEAAVDAAMGK